MIWAPKSAGEPFEVKGAGTVFPVYADREFNREHPECIGWQVDVDGERFIIAAVDRHVPATPIHPGEIIGLLRKPQARLT